MRQAALAPARLASRFPHPASRSGLHRLSRALECERVTVLRAVDTDTVALRVLSLEHRDRERILEQPLNRPLERASPVDGLVALGHQPVLRGGGAFWSTLRGR